MDVAGDAQVHDGSAFRMAFGIVEVGWLDVAVVDALPVHLSKAVRITGKGQEHLAPPQAFAFSALDRVAKRTPGHARKEVHHKEGLPVSGMLHHEEVNETHEARIAQLRHDLCLAVETLRVGGLEQVLDRHQPGRVLVSSLEHFAETAFANALQDSVGVGAVPQVAEADRPQCLAKRREIGKSVLP